MRAGFIPPEIVFTGVGKTRAELAQAIDLGVKTIDAESEGELERIDAIARERQTRARVAIRVNPDIDARSHPHISTGLKTNKFGVSIDEARTCACECAIAPASRSSASTPTSARRSSISSRCGAPPARSSSSPAGSSPRACRSSTSISAAASVSRAHGTVAPTAQEYAEAVLPIVRGSGLSIILEPGRSIVGPSGALLTRVVDVKVQPGGKLFVILDAGMTELIRPMLYNAYHRIEPVETREGPEMLSDIVGPLCESSDTLGKDRRLPRPEVGDLFAVLDAGAYGSVMASNYNRRTLPPEVMVQDGRVTVIRRRQTIDDMLALEA